MKPFKDMSTKRLRRMMFAIEEELRSRGRATLKDYRPAMPDPVPLPAITDQQVSEYDRVNGLLGQVVAGFAARRANTSHWAEQEYISRKHRRFVQARNELTALDHPDSLKYWTRQCNLVLAHWRQIEDPK